MLLFPVVALITGSVADSDNRNKFYVAATRFYLKAYMKFLSAKGGMKQLLIK